MHLSRLAMTGDVKQKIRYYLTGSPLAVLHVLVECTCNLFVHTKSHLVLSIEY